LIKRLGEIENPTVPTSPSRYSLPDTGGKGRAEGSGGTNGED
jgi:hypothetical protein